MTVKVTQKEGEEQVATEIIADAIVAISQGVKKLRSGKLNDDALFLLISKACPAYGPRYKREHVTQKLVKTVLRGIEDLEKTWVKR